MTCFALLVAAVSLPHLGLRLLTVESGSMTPAMPRGALLLERHMPVADLRPGTVITFHPPGRDELVTHRVVAVDRTRGGTVVTTRGDANPGDDPWQAELLDDRTWTVVGALPDAGRLADAVHEPVVLAIVAGALPLLFAVSTLALIWRRRLPEVQPIRGLAPQARPGELPYPALYRAPGPGAGRRRLRRAGGRVAAVVLVAGALVAGGGVHTPASARFTASVSRGHSIASATLRAPALTATNACLVTGSFIQLGWTANSTGETGYRIERRAGAAAFSTLATVAATTKSYRDTTAVVLVTYTYRVTALRGTWSSPASNTPSTGLAGTCG